MRIRPLTLALTGALALGLTSNSFAFFIQQQLPKPVEVARPAVTPNASFALSGYSALTQAGRGKAGVFLGRGNEVPLSVAGKSIVPKGWSFIWDAKAGRAPKVSYRGDGKRSWLDLLEGIGSAHGVRFLVDWNNRRVLATRANNTMSAQLTDRAAPAPATEAGDATKTKTEPKTMASRLASSTAVSSTAVSSSLPKAKPVLRIQKPWTLEPGGLKAQLEAWAKRANYQLVWSLDSDVLIESKASFSGGFDEAATDLLSALRSAGWSGSGELYQSNRVLVVRNKEVQQ